MRVRLLNYIFYKKKLKNQWIPPQKEILLKSLRSHPEEKSGLDSPDPTPKRNLV